MKLKSFLCSAFAALAALCVGLAVNLQAHTASALSLEPFSAIQNPSDPSQFSDMPSSYCLRDDYVVYAQHQDKLGYCWNFAATMSASTTLMRHTNEYYDFSEAWSGLAYYNHTTSKFNIGAGGSISYQTQAMQQGGLMLETDLPYQYSYVMSNENASDFYNFFRPYGNTDLASCLTSKSFQRSQVEEIKNHIYTQGSAYMAFQFKTGFVEDENGLHALPPNQKNTNSAHAISVIGWDDNYEREFYLDGAESPTRFKGAWLVLNSYTEASGRDGVSFIFYEDTNYYQITGYTYTPNTDKELYFYDKIEEGYSYPNHVKGKYCGEFTAQDGTTKQKNIFYDDVNLEYSYIISNGANIKGIAIYLDNVNVTKDFNVRIDGENKRFYISKNNAAYGQYKVLVSYGDEKNSSTYLNNFFVTHGLLGEKLEFDYENNGFAFNTGKDLEYYSVITANKNYALYTNQLNGALSFLPIHQSVYSEQNMSVPTLSYTIPQEDGCATVTHIFTSNSGYSLNYNFHFEYYEDTSLQPVYVFYDLGGGINHPKNYGKELASPTADLLLYEPTREGYTFAGWYLDYGNGSKKVSQDGNLHYVDWEDIHHLGESPTLHNRSYYSTYYNNSNVVFLYAHWEETQYYDVEMNIIGNGSTQIGEKISISSEDSVKYLFKPDKGHCLSGLKINGVSVSPEELSQITKKGLLLEGVNQDICIEATFSEGSFLCLNFGENIKTAYLTKTIDGVTEKFYSGDCIPAKYFERKIPAYSISFTLVVEVEDATDGTYVLENVDTYLVLDEGIFAKDIFLRNSALIETNLPSAVKKPIEPVQLTYTVSGFYIDHYLSADSEATNGEQNGGVYDAGQIVYLFVKKPEETNVYRYVLPDGFEDVGNGWCRKRVYVSADYPDLGNIKVQRRYQLYTITWKNWDGTVLCTEEFEYGERPSYSIWNPEPTRPDDEQYTYTFSGWEPNFSIVQEDTSYTAVYSASLRQFAITVSPSEHGTITPNKDTLITYSHSLTCIFTPNEGYKIKDVIIDGESIGPASTYTFTNVVSDHTVSVEFEILKHNVVFSTAGNGSVNYDQALESVPFGESRLLTFTPEDGWRVLCVFVNGQRIDVTDNQILLENITQNAYISVVFEKEIDNTAFIAAIVSTSVLALGSITALICLVGKAKKKAKTKSFDETIRTLEE